MMHPMWWVWSPWGIGMMLTMVLFWGFVVIGIIVGIRWLLRSSMSSPADRAVNILRERYARGEIGKEEFDSKLKDLGDQS